MHDWKALVDARLAPLPLDPPRASEIVDELAQHVAEHHAELVASGMADDEALAVVLRPLDDPLRLSREIARADRPRSSAPTPPPAAGVNLASDLCRDVAYAARLLTWAPGFAAAAIVTLAIGIGANCAIFSLVNAVVLRPLPYADPDRLVVVGERDRDGRTGNVGYLTFLDWRERTHAFDDMALIRDWTPTLVTKGEPERVNGMRVSANYFRMLGIRPALGRDFTPGEDRPDRWRVVLLSNGLWRRRFAADVSVVGRVITMDDRQYTVIGVLPAGFEPLVSEHFYQRAEMWALVGYDASLPYACRSCQHLRAIARLQPGASPRVAAADVNGVQAQLRLEHPTDYEMTTLAVTPLKDELAGNVRPVLMALMGAVAIVLLIACANCASLLLARLTRRERDLALRTALGASRGRIVRQLLAESALVAAIGGGAGLLLSVAGVRMLTATHASAIARLENTQVDGRVVAFAASISLATVFAFGLLPALRASRVNLQWALHGEGRQSAQGPTSTARRLLVAGDVALAVVLLAGAGLMIRSVGRLLEVDPGFDPRRVLMMRMALFGAPYAQDDQVLRATDEILMRLSRLPGVEAAAAASQIPLGGNGDRYGFHIQERPSLNPADDPSVERYGVTPAYFAVMRVPLERGRLFTADDRADTQPVLIISELTARTLWPNDDPIGAHVRVGGAESGPWRTIVGLVGDVRHEALSSPTTMQMYVPETQFTDSDLAIVMRANGDPGLLAAEARQTIWSIAPRAPVYETAPLESMVSRSLGSRWLLMQLLTLFAASALLLTAIGVFAVISHGVSERAREIGIRAALGASRADIVRLVLGGGLTGVIVGLGAGLIGTISTTRYLKGSLYGVSATDPTTLAGVVIVLFVVALLAEVLPVASALRVDPAVALRQE